ncbi:hypothetical protein F511_34577 [Dorcoceras hygrometricum]|uniref:Uncharacterized protein n=1 Tax=Dorcoceras hygrometricum TaxID=472368 RepID=A0A2Z7BGI8_9LAMI|nr:hypothetical protein F511_34577 [Dorcoceras hygrometricum]
MKAMFSSTGVTFRPPNKRKEMKVEYRQLHDIVSKALCAKLGPSMCTLSILLEKVVKVDLGESMALHPLKVLNSRSVLTYMKKNHTVVPTGESRKASGDTTSEKTFTAEGLQSLMNRPKKEAIEKMVKDKGLAKIEDEFMPWAETELVSKLLEWRMLVLYKMYEKELKKKHRALRLLAGLQLMVPESLVTGSSQDDILKITWTEGRIMSNQGTTTPDQEKEKQQPKEAEHMILAIEHRAHEEEQPAPEAEETARIEHQAQEHIEEISRIVENVDGAEADDSVEHEAHDEEEHQEEEHRAQKKECPAQADEQQAHERQAQEEPAQQEEQPDEHQAQAGSSPSSPKVKRVLESLDSKIDMVRDTQTYMKHESDISRRILSKKIDEVVANVNSSLKKLETRLVRQFIEHQLQIASDLDFMKMQLAELVNHFKRQVIPKRVKGKKRRLL